MKTIINIQYKPLLVLLLAAGFMGCDKLLEVPPKPDEISVGRVFKDSTSAIAAITGVYVLMTSHGHFEWGGIAYNTARSADEAVYTRGTDYFALDSLLYTNSDVYTMWRQAFTSLLMINTNISGLQASTLSATLQRQLLGEMLFSRAFVNFYLVNIWGDAIPLILSHDVDANKFAKSVSRKQVYDQIITDLLQAQQLLTNTYAGQGKARPNVMAVNALLARVYLYLRRYSDAIAQANTVINSNLYTPLPSPATAFLETSKEAIWQLMPPGSQTIEGVGDAYIYLSTATRLTPQLLAAFEPGDLRRQHWIVDNLYADSVYTTAAKYKRYGLNVRTLPLEYYIVLRLAEQYLIRAEANAQLGQTHAATADLDVIRARAGLQPLPATLTQQQCMAAVEQERRVELFTEGGHRWLDLKRWPGINNPNLSRADEIVGPIKRDWQPTDKWYPVPRSELQVNPFLVQNPGYPAR